MRVSFNILGATLLFAAVGCGASFPAPTQRMADAESAERTAKELGAESQPGAKLAVKLADEQIVRAKQLVEAGDNQRADFVLLRARADAELAVALTREQTALAEVGKASAQSKTTFNANSAGAQP